MWAARVVFPLRWLDTDSPASSGEAVLGGILVEEDTWARDANARRERALAKVQERAEHNRLAGWVSGALAALGLLTVLFGYLKGGRVHPVSYTQTMDSTLPEESPALVSYFYYRQVQGAALGATLFDLARKGILSLEQDSAKKKWYESGPNFTIRLDRNEWRGQRAQLQQFESSLIEFFFEVVAEGEDALHSRRLRKARSKMVKWFKGWKKAVRLAAGDYPYYDPASRRATLFSALVAGGIVVAGGLEWSPDIDADVLAPLFDLSRNDMLLWIDAHRIEHIRAGQFVRATRSAIRNSAETMTNDR